jgi:predicted PurR-regulated permease PerM
MSDRVELLFIFLGAIIGGFITTALVANIGHYLAKILKKSGKDRRLDIGICVTIVLLILVIMLIAAGTTFEVLIRSAASVIGALLFVKFAGRRKQASSLDADA